MNEQVKSHIFDRSLTNKPIGKGTGLGLSISYEIFVERYQGLIWYESEIGKGTTFCLQVPVRQLVIIQES